jgi:alanine racemase
VHDPLQIELLETHRDARRFVVWIKMDTGMNRLGFRPEAFMAALGRLRALTVPALELRAMTHLARADERSEPMTVAQVERFEATLAAAGLTGARRLSTSIGNSAGTLAHPRAHGDWVRPGLALYGVSPFADVTAERHGLKPVMTLETTVLTVREVRRGETVGYAGAWRAERDSSIAILAAGYGDGLPRHLASGTPVRVAGGRYPLVGRVSMDMIAIDVTGAPEVSVGSRAVVWGEGLPVEEVAAHAETIPYELLCGVSQRVPLELK